MTLPALSTKPYLPSVLTFVKPSEKIIRIIILWWDNDFTCIINKSPFAIFFGNVYIFCHRCTPKNIHPSIFHTTPKRKAQPLNKSHNETFVYTLPPSKKIIKNACTHSPDIHRRWSRNARHQRYDDSSSTQVHPKHRSHSLSYPNHKSTKIFAKNLLYYVKFFVKKSRL